MDRHPDQQQCCMALAFRGAAWTDPDSIPLMVMQTMLGGWDRNNTSGKHAGSLLTQKIATDELADAFMAFNTNYHDTGLFGVYAVTDRWATRLQGDYIGLKVSSLPKLNPPMLND